ncbi:hypothetical protein CEE45_06850 [Candidatus Heimdallarchaeota archaeon B3_Heim]|nr:MAG: hypothetical protein CEE45_06850 [Candidatus Heimdallarchaeota archaeon B3_Heim]
MRTSWVREINVFQKPTRSINWRIGLVYPNSYSVGMSGLSVKLLYHLLNQHQNIFTERIFKPNEKNVIPRSLETDSALPQFNVLAFSFQFELDYINAIKMLQISKIPLFTKDRNNSHPLLIAGGPAVTANPFPILDIFDFVFMGEFESIADDFLETLIDSKFTNIHDSIAILPGFYSSDNYVESVKPIVTENLDAVNYPIAQVRPIYGQPQKKIGLDGYFLQVSRGCPHGCHYCLIGNIFRPHRERSIINLQQLITSGNIETQTNHFSLIGSSTADYSKIEELITFFLEKGLRFTLPSIRVDSGEEILNLLKQAGQNSLTIAPETGLTETRRDVGKKISNEQIYSFTSEATKSGISQLKTYFILGLTSDPNMEAKAIADLMTDLKHKNANMKFKLSITPLVPKKGTKFGTKCVDYTSITKGVKFLKKNLGKNLTYKVFPTRWAVIQAILSIGGRELAPIMEELALRDGSYQAWRKTLKVDPQDFYQQNYCS